MFLLLGVVVTSICQSTFECTKTLYGHDHSVSAVVFTPGVCAYEKRECACVICARTAD